MIFFHKVSSDPVTDYLEETSRLSNIPTNLPRERKRKSTEPLIQNDGKVRRQSLHRKAKSRSGLANESAHLSVSSSPETASSSFQNPASLHLGDSGSELNANKTKVTCGNYDSSSS